MALLSSWTSALRAKPDKPLIVRDSDLRDKGLVEMIYKAPLFSPNAFRADCAAAAAPASKGLSASQARA